jgi:hypothetical protein
MIHSSCTNLAFPCFADKKVLSLLLPFTDPVLYVAKFLGDADPHPH